MTALTQRTMRKIPNFPMPLKNEAYQSVISRHLARSAGTPANNLKKLGLIGASARNIIPNSIHILPSRLPVAHPWATDAAHIILHHSTIPLFLQFSHPTVYSHLISKLSQGKSTNPIATLGFTHLHTRTLLIENDFKFCPQCLEEDLDNHGFPAFYRHHQPKFVKICPKHSTILLSFCRNCASSLSATKTWRLPNSCSCLYPNFQPAISAKPSTDTLEALLHLSKRTLSVINESQLEPTLATDLTAKLYEAGAVTASGHLKHAEIRELITSIYPADFLRTLDLETWISKRRINAISLKLAPNRTPNFLQCLLVLDALEGFQRPQRPSPLFRDLNIPNKYVVLSAMQNSETSIVKLANSLGIGFNRMITTLRHHRIRLPLTQSFVERNGVYRIESIRGALRSGLPIQQITSQYSISPWSLDLIRLDSIELDSLHKDGALKAKISNYRSIISDFIDSNSTATRSSARKAHPHVVDLLYSQDQEWLDKALPIAANYQNTKRAKHRVDINQLDEQFVQALRKQAQHFLQQSGRPKRVTTTMLLKSVGITSILGPKPNTPRCKRAFCEAQQLAETIESFEARLISWAVNEYAKLHLPISTNRLRRVARMPANRLHKSRDLIIKLAASLDLGFDSRCTLSPLYQKPYKAVEKHESESLGTK